MEEIIKPTPKQQDIIDSDNDTIVVSNPGTGKTTILSFKVIKLLENKVNPENILCITFTKKARKEMINAIYNKAKGKFSDADISKIEIHTFHSFANQYLIDKGLISREIVENNSMRFSILNSFKKNQALHYSKDYLISTMVPNTENSIRYIKNFGITPDKINIKKATKILQEIFDEKSSSYTLDEMKSFLEYFIKAYQDYEKTKDLQTVDYSDMLLMFKEKFQGHKFEYVLVDEMQDMNNIQSEIVTKVAKKLFLVGDAKQAIFGFQGGSVKNFEKFKNTCEKKILPGNWRSTQQILDYSKEYFLNKTAKKEDFEEELADFNSRLTGEIPKIFFTDAHLSKTKEIIAENPNKTIGIITRTNSQIIEISNFFDSNNIFYSSTSSQASTKQAKNEIQNYLKGLLSDRIEDKISATFTIFAPYSLKEAFAFSNAYKSKEFGKLSKIKSWGLKLDRIDLDKRFNDLILPISISKGAEWFTSAMTIKKEIDQYLTFEIPTLDGLFDFISIGEESYSEQGSKSKITLTTVHKAKGRAFDVVVYIPHSSRINNFIDNITSSILSSSDIQVESELAEESLRLDFVAFTRAKEKLVVIAGNKEPRSYYIDGLSKFKDDDLKDESVKIEPNPRLSEAYLLFVKRDFLGAKKLLDSTDEWLTEYIKNYFATVDHFSYSSIKTKPYEFLKHSIINIPSYSKESDFGKTVHEALDDILVGKKKIEDYPDNVAKAAQKGLDAIEQLKKEYPGLRVDSTEKRLKVLLGSLTNYTDAPIHFTGYIDTVLKHDTGYLIVDYKTSNKSDRASEHKRQLAVYKKIFSIMNDIPEEQISTYVVFVSLQGNINTGKFDSETSKGTRDVYPTFEKHLQKVLEWKKDPDKFIKELLEVKNDDQLYSTIKEKLDISK